MKNIIIFLVSFTLSSCGFLFQTMKKDHYDPKIANHGCIILDVNVDDYKVYVDGKLYENRPEGISDKKYNKQTQKLANKKAQGKTIKKLEKKYSDKYIIIKKDAKIRKITIKKEGYIDQTFEVHRKFNAMSITNIFGIQFFGTGFIIDAFTGGYTKFKEGTLKVNLAVDPSKVAPEVVKIESVRDTASFKKSNQKVDISINPAVSSSENVEFLKKYTPTEDTDKQIHSVVKTRLSRQAVYHSFSLVDSLNLIAYCRPDQVLEIRNSQTGQTYFIEKNMPCDRVTFSPKGTFAAVTAKFDNAVRSDEENELRILDIKNKKWLWSLPPDMVKNKEILDFKFSDSERAIMIRFEDEVILLDARTGKQKGSVGVFEMKKFQFPGKKFVSEEIVETSFVNDSTAKIFTRTLYFNYRVGRKILSFIPLIGSLVNGTATERKDIIASYVYQFDKKKIKDIVSFNDIDIPNYIESNIFIKNDFLLCYLSNSNQLGILKLDETKRTENFEFIDFPVSLSDVEIGNDDIMYYTLVSSPKLYRLDLNTKNKLQTLNDHVAPASDVELYPSRNLVISSDVNGIKNFWDMKSGLLKYKLYSANDGEYFISTIDNYYQCSKGILPDVAFLKSNELHQFDSYDLLLNRPDLVLKQTGIKETALINSYEKAYEKRLQKMGFPLNFDLKEIKLPQCKIKNQVEIPVSTKTDLLKINVDASDDSGISFIQLKINNVLIDKIKCRGNLDKTVSKELDIKLQSGENRIQISAFNTKGVESLIETVQIISTKEVARNIYFVGIGASKYTQSNFNLSYADKDIRDIIDNLKSSYKNLIIDTLINEKVTRENILKIKKNLMKTQINDIVIISVNGHGILDKYFNFYAATYDLDFNSPSERGISFEELEGLLSDIPARNRMMLIDACHSGVIDQEEIVITNNLEKSKVKEVKFRGNDQSLNLEYRNGISSFQLMRDMFYEISYETGTHIISAAGGAEFALESDKFSNGVFTYSIIEGLFSNKADRNNSGDVTVSELKKFVYKTVTELTDGKQTPTGRRENVLNDFVILPKK